MAKSLVLHKYDTAHIKHVQYLFPMIYNINRHDRHKVKTDIEANLMKSPVKSYVTTQTPATLGNAGQNNDWRCPERTHVNSS